MLKKISFFIFLISWLVGAWVIGRGQGTSQVNITPVPLREVPATNLNQNGNVNLPLPTIQAAPTLDLATVAQHASATSCWLIIHGNVYDVTTFLNLHPGSSAPILPYCGGEASHAFDTKDVGQSHSNEATKLLQQYFIGPLGAALSSSPVVPTNTNAAAPTNSAIAPPSATPVNTNTNRAVPRPAPATVPLTMAELAKHASSRDCWLLISGKIYNVTNFLFRHPGNASTILPYCGRDATQAFATKNTGSSHSAAAHALLAQFYLGPLNSSTTQQQLQNTNSANPATTPGGESDEGD